MTGHQPERSTAFSAKGGTEKMTVRVPTGLLEDVDKEVDDRGFMSRSEFVRKLMYDAVREDA